MTDLLFEPIMIGDLSVKNRIYLPAMHLNMTMDREVNDRLVAFYAERARGGAGLISVGYATVDELSGTFTNLGAHDDKFIPGLARLARGIQDHGARAVIQLNHAGRYMHSFLLGGKQPVAPSSVPSRLTKEAPRELTIDEIQGIVAAFGAAAKRVQAAGYDAVEVLSSTGYLISEFLSRVTNKREDEYGGPIENRMRFGVEVMRSIKEATGPDYPLIVRINGHDMMDADGGSTRQDLQAYARELERAGVDAIGVNVGWHEARVPQIVAEVPRGAYAYLARGVKEAVSVPVIASHRINNPALARELLADDMCDMVAMGRGLIADPYLPEKARTNREDEIIHCIACGQGCFDNLIKFRPVDCLCNPRAGREAETNIERTAAPRKVMVVGGGPAGMSAAVAAADRGHDVTLFEQADQLGGQLHLAGAPPGRDEFIQLATDLAKQTALRNIKVVLNNSVDEATLAEEAPDVVVLATGAVPTSFPVPGADGEQVVQAWDVLAGRVQTGRRVVVVGGGSVGVETALFLADKGTLSGETLKFLLVHGAETPETLLELAVKGTKHVVLVEMESRVGRDLGKTTRWGMLQDADRAGIDIRTATSVVEITDSGVLVDCDGTVEELAGDTVVIAVGAQPHNPLADLVASRGIEVHVVGDATKVAKANDAIMQGFEVGRSLC